MSVRSFFDANVLVYTDDADVPEKCEQALALWEEHRNSGRAVVSVQVLQEFCGQHPQARGRSGYCHRKTDSRRTTRSTGSFREAAPTACRPWGRGRCAGRKGIVLPLGALTRLRSNPFWGLVVEEVGRGF